MTHDDLAFLRAEERDVKDRLGDLPPNARLTRSSLEARLRVLAAEREQAERLPLARRIELTFAGEPVEGSRSIEAQFGGKAVSLFTEAVALIAASFSGAEIQPGGPIPGARDRRLRIVGPATGSFGFELELPPPEPGLPENLDPEAEALKATLTTLGRALAGDDEGLSESLSTVELRATRKLGEFVKLNLDRRALFTVRFEGRHLAVPNLAATRRAAAALRADDVEQGTVTFRAILTGLRPSKPDFECVREGSGEVLFGPIDRGADLQRIQGLFRQSALFRFRETRVRNAQARYVLLGLGEPDEAERGP